MMKDEGLSESMSASLVLILGNIPQRGAVDCLAVTILIVQAANCLVL
jgi:hypothetical protein